MADAFQHRGRQFCSWPSRFFGEAPRCFESAVHREEGQLCSAAPVLDDGSHGVAIRGPYRDSVLTGDPLAFGFTPSRETAVDAPFADAPTGGDRVGVETGTAANNGSDQAFGNSHRGRHLQVVGRLRRRRSRLGRGFFRCASGRVAARAGQVLAGDPVAVGVEPVRIARAEIFLGFGLIREVGAVVVTSHRSRRRLNQHACGRQAEYYGEPCPDLHIPPVFPSLPRTSSARN